LVGYEVQTVVRSGSGPLIFARPKRTHELGRQSGEDIKLLVRTDIAYSDPSACRRQGCSATPHRERIDRIQIWVVRERGNVRLHLGNQMYNVGRITLDGYSKIKIEQRTYPVKVVTEGERTYWHFQDRFYWENDGLASDEVHALLVSEQQRKRGPPGMGGRSEDRRSS
jgi:hypothetical protein